MIETWVVKRSFVFKTKAGTK